MCDLFLRNGVKYTGKYATNEKGKKGFEQLKKCDRCGGKGGLDMWRWTGWTCFKCGGAGNLGYEHINLYTAAELEKLNVRAEAARVKREAKKQILAESRKDDFLAAYGDLLDRAEKYADVNYFLRDVCEKARKNNSLTEKQLAAIEPAIEKAAAEKAEKEKQTNDFLAAYGELIEEAEKYAAENDFIKSICKQAREYFSLTPKQIYFLKKAVKKEQKRS